MSTDDDRESAGETEAALVRTSSSARRPPRDPWDQRLDESDEAYGQFRAYLALDVTRDLDQLAEHLDTPKYDLGVLADLWDWDERARAWDAHQARTAAYAVAARRHAAAGRAAAAGLAAVEAAHAGIATLNPDKIGATSAAELLNAGSRALAWGAGDPSDYRPAQPGDSDTLGDIAADPAMPASLRARAGATLERRDTTVDAAEADDEILDRVTDALGDDEDTRRAVAAALTGQAVPEPGSDDDDRPDLAGDLDEIMRRKS